MNTGNGWATWNTNGDFVKWYVQDSVANGMVAVFPYYQMLQSSPATGGGESAKDLNNLKNASTMAAYWADVRLFMQKAEAGASGHPVVLHVEPDLWGYIEQAATGNDAKNVPASVASSGDADLAGLAQHRRRLRQGVRQAARPVRAERAARLSRVGVGDDVRPPRAARRATPRPTSSRPRRRPSTAR